jgi:hypothetical protein
VRSGSLMLPRAWASRDCRQVARRQTEHVYSRLQRVNTRETPQLFCSP